MRRARRPFARGTASFYWPGSFCFISCLHRFTGRSPASAIGSFIRRQLTAPGTQSMATPFPTSSPPKLVTPLGLDDCWLSRFYYLRRRTLHYATLSADRAVPFCLAQPSYSQLSPLVASRRTFTDCHAFDVNIIATHYGAIIPLTSRHAPRFVVAYSLHRFIPVLPTTPRSIPFCYRFLLEIEATLFRLRLIDLRTQTIHYSLCRYTVSCASPLTQPPLRAKPLPWPPAYPREVPTASWQTPSGATPLSIILLSPTSAFSLQLARLLASTKRATILRVR